jgi:DnaJ-class molecular chaperone
MENYYEILNIADTSSQEEIKKRFRELQFERHPDRKKNDKKLQEYHKICEAFNFLSDTNKKVQLDRQLQNKLILRDGDFDNIDNTNERELCFLKEKILTNYLGEINDSTKMNNINKLDKIKFPNDLLRNVVSNNNMKHILETLVENTLETDAINENIQTINYKKVITYTQAYDGCVIPIDIERQINTTNNVLVKYERETFYLTIPIGTDNNEIFTLIEKGNIYGQKKSDVRVVIELEPNSHFSRNGLNLIYHKSITLKEALLGFTFSFEHLNGQTYNIINYGQVIQPNEQKTIPNKGFKRPNMEVSGELCIIFNIILPEKITENIKQFANLL